MTTYFDIPLQFRPVLRLVSTSTGVDRTAYAREVVGSVYAHRDDGQVASDATALVDLKPWSLVDAHATMSSLPADVASALTSLMHHVDATCRHYFADLPDPVAGSATSCIAGNSDGLPPATVVWTRTGESGVVQFGFPLLGIDVATAKVQERSLTFAAPGPVHRSSGIERQADLSAKGIIESATEVASSVSWALPPPWNVAVTAGLSVLQMILHATDDPKGPSPLDQLKTDLQNFIAEQQLLDYSGNFAEFTHQLSDRTADMTFQPADIDSLGHQYLEDFQQYVLHDSTGALRVSDNVTHLIGRLQNVGTDVSSSGTDPTKVDGKIKDAKEALDLTCTGITLWMTGMKAVMQVRACAVAKELGSQDVSTYLDDNHSWWSTFHMIRNGVLGKSVDGTVLDKGWAADIADWIAQVRVARLALIHPSEQSVKKEWQMTTTSGGLPSGYEADVRGWRFVDLAENDEWKHFRPDTVEGGDACHTGHTVSHQSDVDVDRAAHIVQVNAALDVVLGGATKAIETWKTTLTGFEQLAHLPGPTTAPAVAVKTSGTPTPSGAWVDGAKVEYSVMYVNASGPSDGGTWSTPADVAGFAFASVSGIPQCADAKPTKLWVARRVTAPDGTKVVRTVKILDPGVATFDDTRP